MSLLFLLPILPVLFFTSCASAPLPREQREITFVEKTSATKEQAYQRVLVELAKSVVDSKSAVKVQDQANGQIITRIALQCGEAKDFMGGPAKILFNLEIGTKDNKARMVFEALELTSYSLMGDPVSTRQISSVSDLEKIKVCVQREKDDLLRAINAGKGSDW